ncbi:DJ-1/PfpI family protein [bacterium]|nr:DJ-1/PfpI family protein [bacterium]
MSTRKIVFLVLPKMHLMDLSGPDQVFYEAICQGADLSIEYCSFTKHLKTSAGLQLGKMQNFRDVRITTGDCLFIPGATLKYINSDSFKSQTAVFEWIRDCNSNGVNICSICTGAFVLAQSGILNHKNCTTHFTDAAEFRRYFPKARVIENVLFVQDGNIYTSAGVASGIDMALHILEKIKGPYFTHKVARELVIYTRRSADQLQQSIFLEHRNHIHSGIHKAQDYLIENIHKKISLTQLAQIACMSERNFTRIFKKDTGITPNQYVMLIRKEKVKELLKRPDLSRKQIVQQVGLRSERQLNKYIS